MEPRGYLLKIFILLVLICLFLLDVIGAFTWWYNIKEYIGRPIYYAVGAVSNASQSLVLSMFQASTLRDENIQLRTSILELEQENSNLKLAQKIAPEVTEHVKRLRDLGVKNSVSVIVLNKNYAPGYIQIDQGSDQGITKDQIVTFKGSYVGTVSEVHNQTAIVQTIFAADFSTTGHILNRKLVTALKQDQNQLVAKEILLSEDVKPNDIIYVNLKDTTIFIPVGVVITVNTDAAQSTKTAILNPYFTLDEINSAAVIK